MNKESRDQSTIVSANVNSSTMFSKSKNCMQVGSFHSVFSAYKSEGFRALLLRLSTILYYTILCYAILSCTLDEIDS